MRKLTDILTTILKATTIGFVFWLRPRAAR
ncbi:hypothetical protein [Dickeya oryzae]